MLSSHRFLPIAKVRAGMVLFEDVLDGQGHVLLPAGVVLTDALIARLPAHGISALPIAVTPAESAPPVDRAAVLQRIAQVFRRIDPHDPAQAPTRELRRMVEAYRLGEML